MDGTTTADLAGRILETAGTGQNIQETAGRLEASMAYVRIAEEGATTGRRTLVLTASGERARSIRQTLRKNGIQPHQSDGQPSYSLPEGTITITTAHRARQIEGGADLTILDLNDPGGDSRATEASRTTEPDITINPHRRTSLRTDEEPSADSITARRGAGRPSLRRTVRIDNLP